MRFKRLFWQFYPFTIFIVSFTLVAFVVMAGIQFANFHRSRALNELQSYSQLLIKSIKEHSLLDDESLLAKYLSEYKTISNVRYSIIDNAGRVIADTHFESIDMDNHASRKEVAEALSKGSSHSLRYSYTMKDSYLYFAKKMEWKGDYFIVRSSRNLNDLDNLLWKLFEHMIWAGMVLVISMALLSWWVSSRIVMPIEALEEQTQKILEGDFNIDLNFNKFGTYELDRLAQAIKKITSHLNNRILKVNTQKNQQEALFSSLTESVIAITNNASIKRMNHSAMDLLGLKRDLDLSRDLSIDECIHIPEILKFVKMAINSDERLEDEATIYNPRQKFLRLTSSPYLNPKGEKWGTVIVISDITKLKQLEEHRKEFVANVSHELRTPLTSIQGYAETIQLHKITDINKLMPFMKIISEQAQRLRSIIEDLMLLSSIDRYKQDEQFEFEKVNLANLIQAAVSISKVNAEKNNKKIQTDLEANIYAKVNSNLLEQAITNLLENAIKYSEKSELIEVSLRKTDRHIEISVRDYGPGIDEKHHERLFERFYRVDKARSRNMGGTGLGLSLVKNICDLHNAEITLDPNVQKGTSFLIKLPNIET